jgi:hypothetical protein
LKRRKKMVKIVGLGITLITALLAGCATGPGYVETYPAATVTTYPAPVTTYNPAVKTTTTTTRTSYGSPGYGYPYSNNYSNVGYYPAVDSSAFYYPNDVYYAPSEYNYLGY